MVFGLIMGVIIGEYNYSPLKQRVDDLKEATNKMITACEAKTGFTEECEIHVLAFPKGALNKNNTKSKPKGRFI